MGKEGNEHVFVKRKKKENFRTKLNSTKTEQTFPA